MDEEHEQIIVFLYPFITEFCQDFICPVGVFLLSAFRTSRPSALNGIHVPEGASWLASWDDVTLLILLHSFCHCPGLPADVSCPKADLATSQNSK